MTKVGERHSAVNPKDVSKLIEANKSIVWSLVRRMIPREHNPEDIVQDILIKAIDKLPGFKGESRFSTWLYRISLNHIIDYKRKKSREVPLEHDLWKTDDEDTDLIASKIQRCLSGILSHLNQSERDAIVLADFFGFQQNEGAAYLNTTPANFRKRLSRARLALKQHMEVSTLSNRAANPIKNRPDAPIRTEVVRYMEKIRNTYLA